MAEVALRGVRKDFGSTRVIHGVDCEIAQGEFLVIVGPSGCGKSTLLRMIAGLEQVTAGEIAISGKVVNDLEPAQRDIAMVFQNYALYPHMSVFDNMAYGLRIKGFAKAEIRERVDRAARILELEELLQRKPRQLSGGQRQRVAMGRAIVREPAVFLFDEPLSNLDAKLRVQMRVEIKRLQARLGITSVYVTHDQVEAMTLGHRLMVLNGGVVEQIGSPLELYQHPASRFVAGFIGSPAMNLIETRVARDGRHLRMGGGGIALTDPMEPGRAVVAGLRPEHLTPTAEATAPLHLVVELVEQLGADSLVHGRLLEEEGREGPELTVRLPGLEAPEPGARLPLAPTPGQLHLFDPEDGRRL